MHRKNIEHILSQVRAGELSVEQALKRLEQLPYEDLGFASIDHHRALRKGFPEVVFCQSKTVEQAREIIRKIAEHGSVLATRASRELYDAVKLDAPEAEYHPDARAIVIRKHGEPEPPPSTKYILVLSAGTSDIPVAEEAALTARVMGSRVETVYDVGVAGIHRIFDKVELIQEANVLIVVAGMDGALPSVVTGLVRKPVIAVPTSVGYGASFQGVAPLLTMLNNCAPGSVVVNIDNGFGAGYFASLINHM